MEGYIYSDRFEEYDIREDMLRNFNLRFSGINVGKIDINEVAKADIFIADPRMLEKNNLILRELAKQGRKFSGRIIISGPANKEGIINEIEAHLRNKVGSDINGFSVTEERTQSKDDGKDFKIEFKDESETEIKNSVIRAGIAGMGRGTGASYVTMLLAEELASVSPVDSGNVTVFSVGNSYFYDALGMEKRFSAKSFTPAEVLYEHIIKKKKEDLLRDNSCDITEIRDFADLEGIGEEISFVNMDDGISWAVSSPNSLTEKLSFGDELDMLKNLHGNIILWDVGFDNFREKFGEIAENIDVLVFIIDPLPSRMLAEYDIFLKVHGCGIPVIFVINRMNDGVNRQELLNLLKLQNPIDLPLVDLKWIYKAEYACENPYRLDEVRKGSIGPVNKIAELIIEIKEDLRF